MKTHLSFILKYTVIGLASGFLYLIFSGQLKINKDSLDQPQLVFSYAPAINKITPSVVSIYTQSSERTSNSSVGISPRAPYLTKTYLGSGLVVSTHGHIATNKHVIDKATRVVVFLWDNQAFEASFVGADELTDLAVIKIDTENLTPAEFADSELINTGDVVLAIGNPFGLNQSASMGIVSATGRKGLTDTRIGAGGEDQQVQLENYIQTDAAINQGNSGGPLINPLGQVVGISSSSYGQFGAEGINFAIPSSTTVQVINELIEHGKVQRGWLGIQFFQSYGHAIYNIPVPDLGIVISRVHPGSSAAKAGLKPRDIITHINDKPVLNFTEYSRVLLSHTIGDSVKVSGYNTDNTFEKMLVIEKPALSP